VLKKTAIEKISQLAAVLMEKGTLLAPVKEVAGHNFAEINDPQKVDLNFYNTIISPKGAFFPPKEDFIKYKIGKTITEAEQIKVDSKPVFLFGVRPCDVKSSMPRELLIPIGAKEEKQQPFSVMPTI
jgi:hypothetical protein